MKICICGGGSLGHVIAGKIASKGENVSILTRCPEKWNSEIKIDDCEGKIFTGKFSCVTDQAEKIIPDADIVLLLYRPDYYNNEDCTIIKPVITNAKTMKVYNKNTTAIPKAA